MQYLVGLVLVSIMLLGAETGNSDFASAKKRAEEQGKVLYVLITAPDCRWCRKFEETTLADAAVQQKLSSLAVTVHVSRGSGGYPETLKAPMVPMHYFLAPDETVLVKMPGYWGTEDFMSILDDVKRKRK